jgi:uncharacterized protein YaaQ
MLSLRRSLRQASGLPGGFWKRGNTTLLIGCEDEQVDHALELVRQNVSPAAEPGTRHATIFVLKVDHYVHF